MKKLVLLLIVILTLIASVPGSGESATKRIEEFEKAFRLNPMNAIRNICPLDEAKLVNYMVDLWIQFLEYGYYFDAAIEDALLTTTSGSPLEVLHKRMLSEDKVLMRARLAKIVGKIGKPESLSKLLSALKRSGESEFQCAALEALLNYPPEDVVPDILSFIDRKYRPEVRQTAIESLGTLKAVSAIKKLADTAEKDTIEIRCCALWALGNIGGSDIEDAVLAAIKATEPPIRAAGCTAGANVPGEKVRKALCERLTDERWEVISAAVNALRRRNEFESVVPLINAMQNVKGRLIDDFQKALEGITDYKFGCDPKNWKDWLEESGGKITRNPTPRKNETPYVVYHTIRTRSLDMVFCIDISGSMNDKVDAGASSYLGEGAEVKGDTKLAFVKAELIRVIKSLPPEAKFDIITFAEKAEFWRGTQTSADDKAKKAAVMFVDTLTADGGTNIYEAMQKALGALTQKTGYYPKDRTPDTIFLLSDGMPTVGEIIEHETLLETITRINKIRQTTLHTIGVGKDGTPFLKPLAEQNRGEFKLIAK